MKLIISRDESAVMKGFAICFIILHNLLHLVAPLVKENEFTYLYYKAYYMWDHIVNLHPNLMGDFFSFFGFYGVPVFMFLSGYGVSMKYESSKRSANEVSWGGFFRYNFKKLWLLMAPAFVCFLCIQALTNDSFEWAWKPILAQLTLTINLLCEPRCINPGVYWYFGLTLQFYLLYRLLFFRRSNTWMWITLLVTLVMQFAAMTPDNVRQQSELEYLRHNSIGWILPFVMGVWWARKARVQQSTGNEVKDSRLLWAVVFVGSLCLLTICCFHRYWWQLSPAFAVTLSLAFVRVFSGSRIFMKVGVWLGGLSSFLFVTHPLLRPFFLDWIGKEGAPYFECVVYFGCCLVVALFYRWLEGRLVNPLCERIINSGLFASLFQKK